MSNIKEISIPSEKLLKNSEVFKKAGIRSGMTDLALVMGANPRECHIGDFFTGTCTDYWIDVNAPLRSLVHGPKIVSNCHIDYIADDICPWKKNGIRPIIKVSNIETYFKQAFRNDLDINEVIFGQLPVSFNPEVQDELNYRYQSSPNMGLTGKTYEILEAPEYELNGHKYARIICDTYEPLNDGNCYYGKAIWLEVEPLTWYIDKENKLLISTNVLFNMSINSDYYSTFNKTKLYNDLNKKFLKDIIPITIKTNVQNYSDFFERSKKEKQKRFPVDTRFLDNKTLSDIFFEGNEDAEYMPTGYTKVFAPYTHPCWQTFISDNPNHLAKDIDGYECTFGPSVNNKEGEHYKIISLYTNNEPVYAEEFLNRKGQIVYPYPGYPLAISHTKAKVKEKNNLVI